MHRIDVPTASSGLFTDGNPGTGIPSTIVDAAWANAVQENIVQFILSRGIVLTKGDHTQLTAAIASASQDTSSAPFSLANDITIFANITGLILDKTKYKSAVITCDVYRKTATLEYSTIVILSLIYFPVLNQWKLAPVEEKSPGPLSGVTFAVDSTTGQVSYKSSNMAGGTYDGYLRYKLSRFNIA